MTCRCCGQPLVYPAIEGTDGLCFWEAPGRIKRDSCSMGAARWWQRFWSRRRELPPFTQEEWLVNIDIWLKARTKDTT